MAVADTVFTMAEFRLSLQSQAPRVGFQTRAVLMQVQVEAFSFALELVVISQATQA